MLYDKYPWLRYRWLLMVAICVVIFLFSQDARSTVHSDALLGWLLSFFGADSYQVRHWLDGPFCKCAHVVVYSCLGAASYSAWSVWGRRTGNHAVVKAWCFCALFACSDEFHQRFVATRDPSVRDVGLDCAAALVAIAATALIHRRRLARTSPGGQIGLI